MWGKRDPVSISMRTTVASSVVYAVKGDIILHRYREAPAIPRRPRISASGVSVPFRPCIPIQEAWTIFVSIAMKWCANMERTISEDRRRGLDPV